MRVARAVGVARLGLEVANSRFLQTVRVGRVLPHELLCWKQPVVLLKTGPGQ